ncbi:uncharacterized protein MONBRDRAFT_32004, partial [Monosiga brevicollis MX1]
MAMWDANLCLAIIFFCSFCLISLSNSLSLSLEFARSLSLSLSLLLLSLFFSLLLLLSLFFSLSSSLSLLLSLSLPLLLLLSLSLSSSLSLCDFSLNSSGCHCDSMSRDAQRLEALRLQNAQLKEQSQLQRITVSEASKGIMSYCKTTHDPLVPSVWGRVED